MASSGKGWPTGRIGWAFGVVVLFGLGVIFGLIMENVWLGVMLAGVISIGWLIAYESWRGRTPTDDDPFDDGARL